VRIRVPGDKSLTQRALILGALADGESRFTGLSTGADPRSTAAVLRVLGADLSTIPADEGVLRIRGVGLRGLGSGTSPLDFGNSGTGARLMMGVLAGLPSDAVLTGDASLSSRPMRRVSDPLQEMGASFEWLGQEGRLPVRVRGAALHEAHFDAPVASAQVKSAILLAGLVSGVAVQVSEPGRSRDHTERMLRAMGVEVFSREESGRWIVELRDPPQRLSPLDMHIPGDPSSAAFLLGLGAMGFGARGQDEFVVEGVGLNPNRVGFLDVFRRMGVALDIPPLDGGLPWEPVGDVALGLPGALRATEITAAEVPGLIDEIPMIVVLAARAEGVTRITGAGELRVKETDRISALVQNLRAIGVGAEELDDGLEVEGTDGPLAGRIEARGDHRIAMAFGVLGAVPGNEIEIDDPNVTQVSFPGFWELLERVTAPPSRGRGATSERKIGPVVTVDGPAGSGKSSTAKEVARRLGFRHLDSGALYRSLSYGLLQAGVPVEIWPGLRAEELNRLGIRVRPAGRDVEIFLGAQRLTSEIRTLAVTEVVSTVAKLPEVRTWLLGVQRSIGRHGNLIADGRDMGSVVFPDAGLKVYLVADLTERARRRLIQNGSAHPTPEEIGQEADRIAARDREDSEREHSPLVRPDGALDIDTTELDFESQVAAIVERVEGLVAQ
jgi:3-phosphoshikimate 1-carboxyvinyltransferase